MPDPDSARWWYRVALGDLAAARALKRDDSLPARIAASHAQQAAEKALKAVIALAGADPPRTHDLLVLATAAHMRGLELGTVDLVVLSDRIPSARYPDPEETPLASSDALELVAAAAAVIDAVAAHLQLRSVNLDGIEPV